MQKVGPNVSYRVYKDMTEFQLLFPSSPFALPLNMYVHNYNKILTKGEHDECFFPSQTLIK